MFFLLIGITSQASGREELSLTDCLSMAFTRNHQLKAAGLSVQSATAAFHASKSQRLPAVTLSGLYTRIGEITSFSIPMGPGGAKRTLQFGTPNRINADIKVQLPLFTWGRVNNSIALAHTGILLASAQQRQQRISLTARVLQGYYSILLNQEVIRLHEANVERASHHLNVSLTKYKAGLVPRLQTLQAEVQLKNARTQLHDSRKKKKKSLILLGTLIGKPESDIALADTIRYQPVYVDEQSLIQQAVARRSDLETLRLRRQMTQSQIQLAHSGNKPNLFFFSGYNVTNGFDPMEPEKFIDNYNAGIQLTFPVFDGFASNRKVEQTKLEYDALLEQEQEVHELIRLQVCQSVIALQQAAAKIEAQKENIRISQETLKTAERQYRDGLVSSLDVLDAQQMLNQAELLHVQAIFNHIMAKLAICNAVEDFSWFGAEIE